MHSSRMRTARSSSRHRWGVSLHIPSRAGTPPPRAGIPQSKPHPPGQIPLNIPLGCGHGPDSPQLPPWLWAWTKSPSISPLAVGLDQIPLNFPLGCGPGNPQGMLRYHHHPPPLWRPAARHAGIPPAMHAGIAPPL